MTPISYKLAVPAASRPSIEAPFYRGKYVDGSDKSTTLRNPAKEDCATVFLYRDARACQRDRSFRSEGLAAPHSACGQGSQSTDARGLAYRAADRAGYCATAIS